MTNKNTKRTLLASVLSLLLSLAMLTATTFAWFTDSVTSGNNKIVAGNLGIELEYATGFDPETGAVTEWTPVNTETTLFSELNADGETANLWEPGHTEVVYLKIRNTGSLALKYQFTVTGANETKFTNALGQTDCVLSDYLVFGQVESKDEISKYAAREDAWDAAGNTLGLSNYTKSNELLEANGEEYVALIVYMPTTVGDAANYRGDVIPSIDLGISLVATQTASESDSFDHNYDDNANYLTTVATSDAFKEAAAKGHDILLSNDITVAGTTDGDFLADGTIVLDLNGKTITGANNNISTRVRAGDVTIQNGTITAAQGTYCTVSASNGTATIRDMILNNQTAWGNSIKAFENGTVHVYNTTVSSTLGGGAEAAGGIINIYDGCVFTQAGSYDHNSTNVAASGGGTANIYGGSFGSANYGLYVFNSGATINVYGGTVNAAVALRADKSVYENSPSVINIYGGEFTGSIMIATGATLHIEEGTFAETGLTLEQFRAFVDENSAVEEIEGRFVVTK